MQEVSHARPNVNVRSFTPEGTNERKRSGTEALPRSEQVLREQLEKALRDWGWTDHGRITLRWLLCSAELPRTCLAVRYVQQAMQSRRVFSPTSYFVKARVKGWMPSPTQKDLDRRMKLEKEARRAQIAKKQAEELDQYRADDRERSMLLTATRERMPDALLKKLATQVVKSTTLLEFDMQRKAPKLFRRMQQVRLDALVLGYKAESFAPPEGDPAPRGGSGRRSAGESSPPPSPQLPGGSQKDHFQQTSRIGDLLPGEDEIQRDALS